MTAAELAIELEVSVKTARRDLEALAVAGIPVYAQPGRGGGWSLLGGARTDLSGLTSAEARALFLLAGPAASVSPQAKAAIRKLVRALPEPFRAEAAAAASAVAIDPATWGRWPEPPPPLLEHLQRAVIDGVQVRLRYANPRDHRTERTVHPLGVVHKGRLWYLLAGTDGGLRTFRVDRILAVVATGERVVRPNGFVLSTAWQAAVARAEERRRQVTATARVRADRLPGLRDQLGDYLEVLATADDGRLEVQVHGGSAEIIADELAGWGSDVEVLEPEAVRRHLARIGGELVRLYGGR